jgi:predicted nucleic acid-binding protein
VGSLTLPSSGAVYADTSLFIYGIENVQPYATVLAPLWAAASAGTITVVSSELTLMETLVGPYQRNDAVLAADYEAVLRQSGVRAVPITEAVLRTAARLRAVTPGLRTPDAIHAATSSLNSCRLFLTNDKGFKRLSSLTVVVLDEV